MKNQSRRLARFASGLIVCCFSTPPILVLIVFSFNESKSHRDVFHRIYPASGTRQLFWNRADLMTSLFNSLLIALLASAISAVVGTAAAVGISKYRQGGPGASL